MAVIHDRAIDIYKLLNSLPIAISIPDLERELGAKRNNFQLLHKHPLLLDTTPDLSSNKKYKLTPCTLEAFLESIPGGTNTVLSGPADFIAIPRQQISTADFYALLEEFGEYLPRFLDKFRLATEKYDSAPKIEFNLEAMVKFSEEMRNWLDQYMLDPRCSEDDTRYQLFVVED